MNLFEILQRSLEYSIDGFEFPTLNCLPLCYFPYFKFRGFLELVGHGPFFVLLCFQSKEISVRPQDVMGFYLHIHCCVVNPFVFSP